MHRIFMQHTHNTKYSTLHETMSYNPAYTSRDTKWGPEPKVEKYIWCQQWYHIQFFMLYQL